LNKDTFNPFIICTFEKGPIEGKFKKINIPVHLIGSDRFYNPLTIIKMIYFIKKHKIQVIHSHQYFPDIISRISGYISKVPYIYSTYHNIYPWKKSNKLKNRLKVLIDRFTAQNFTTMNIAVSTAVKYYHKRILKLPKNKIMVINNFIDKDFVSKLDKIQIENKKRSLNIKSYNQIALNVASLTIQKDQKNLIKAAKIVIKQFPNAIFLIAGEGVLLESLKKTIEKYRLANNIILLGRRNDINELLNICDLFLLSSKWEGMPVSIIEAMALNKPIVSTNVGGVSDAVTNNLNGLLIEANKPKDLANGINKLFGNEKLAKNMGKEGRKIYDKKFRVDSVIKKKLEPLYFGFLPSK